MLIYKNDDLLNSECEYIAHQCNCVTKNSKGLAKYIFDNYPESNTYIDTNYKRIQGEISVHETDNFKIINMYVQYYPGGPKYKYKNDNEQIRLFYFKKCLEKISELNINSISFSYGIGCGLAGGNWEKYEKMLSNFTKNSGINVYIYRI